MKKTSDSLLLELLPKNIHLTVLISRGFILLGFFFFCISGSHLRVIFMGEFHLYFC